MANSSDSNNSGGVSLDRRTGLDVFVVGFLSSRFFKTLEFRNETVFTKLLHGEAEARHVE